MHRWIHLGLLVAAALLWLPARAAANTVYADLDKDGRPDIITIVTVPKPGLRVWLSGSNRSLLLLTRRPITHVTVSDVDGDGHVDLIASDESANVHVWHPTSRGRLRATRPRAPPRDPGVSGNQGIHTASNDLPSAVLDEGASAPVDTTHRARTASPDAPGAALTASNSTADTHRARPTQPRAPPLG